MRRLPWLTVSVTVVTALVNVTQLAVPGVLDRLQRTPAARHGEPWRLLTSLLVQDGGVTGTVSNLLGLVVLGVVAERVAPRSSWLVAYLGAGLGGELAGLAWQPVGGGNSVAVCGLAGLLTVAQLRSTPGATPGGSLPVLVWVSLLLSIQYPQLLVPGIVLAGLAQHLGGRYPRVRYVVALAVVAATTLLVVAHDIHGAALATGLVLATLLAWRPEVRSDMAG